MNNVIKDIIKRKCSKEDKVKALSSLKEDIAIAEKIISGELSYCEDCDDYYLSSSFQIQTKRETQLVCVYSDPINSGGDEYANKNCNITYRICPKNHKKIINKIFN